MEGTYKIINDIEQIQLLRKLIGWNPLTKQQWEIMLKNSSWMYSVWEKDSLLGMGRAVSDGRYCMIYDVIVHKDYQGKGIGTKIIKSLIKKAKKGIRIGIFIENKEFLIKFYESQGFQPINGMQLIKE